MEIAVNHEKLHGRRITVKTSGFFRGPRLLSNGNPIEGKRGTYALRDIHGKEVMVKMKGNFLDPIPKLEIDGEAFPLDRPLAWYQYVWMGLPIILVFVGGALGAVVGISATYSSARIFRSERTSFSKYLISGLISVAAVIVFVIALVSFQIVIHGTPQG
jgi:hypothetical protein